MISRLVKLFVVIVPTHKLCQCTKYERDSDFQTVANCAVGTIPLSLFTLRPLLLCFQAPILSHEAEARGRRLPQISSYIRNNSQDVNGGSFCKLFACRSEFSKTRESSPGSCTVLQYVSRRG